MTTRDHPEMARCLVPLNKGKLVVSLAHEYEKSFLTLTWEENAKLQSQLLSIQNVDLPDGWIQKLLALGPDLAYVLASLANASLPPQTLRSTFHKFP
jgi:hypothetical protein